MKHIILVIAILFGNLYTIAQPTLEKSYNRIRSGDILVKQQVEFKDPGRKGANVLWDFRKQKIINSEYKVSYFGDNDSLIVAREKRSLSKYSIKKDSLIFVGFENSTTLIHYYKPELHLIYPVHYGNHQENYFFGTGDYCNQLDLTVSGKSSYHADACGMILLPEGEVLENVLRIYYTQRKNEKQTPHYSYSITDTVFSTDSIDYYLINETSYKQTDVYKWYAEGYRYPVFETIINSTYKNGQLFNQEKTSFYFPPNEQNYGLENDPENQEKRERIAAEKEKRKEQERENETETSGKKNINYNAFLSMEKTELIIEYQLEETSDISFRLFDIQGKLLFQQPKEKKNSGYYSLNIPVNRNTMKEYLLQIVVNEKMHSEKILTN